MQAGDVSKEIRRLRIAVWILVALSILNLASGLFARTPTRVLEMSIPPSGQSSELESWEGLTIAQKLDSSSVVLLTRTVRNGRREKEIVHEFLKQAPNTEVFYSVGDEIPSMVCDVKQSSRAGQGSLVLLKGSPATFRESYSIYDGRIPGLGDMPLAKVRNDIRASR